MSLTRDAIFAVDDLPKHEIPIPEWNGSVFVRSLTLAQVNKWTSICSSDDGNNLLARLVVLVACDKDGNPLFTDADIDKLTSKNAMPLKRIVAYAAKMMKDEADIDQLEKKIQA